MDALPPSWGDLPVEVQIMIMAHVPVRDISAVACVSHAWHDLCTDFELWHQLYRRDFGADLRRSYESGDKALAASVPPMGMSWRTAYAHAHFARKWCASGFVHTSSPIFHAPISVVNVVAGEAGQPLLGVAGTFEGDLAVFQMNESGDTSACWQTKVGWVCAAAGDTQRVLTGGTDNLVRVWDTALGTPLRKLIGHLNAVTSVHVSGAHVLTGSWDSGMRVFDLRTRGPPVVHASTALRVDRVEWSGHCAVACGSGQVQQWDLRATRKPVASLGTPRGEGEFLGSAFNGRVLAATHSNVMELWDVSAGTMLTTYTGFACLARGVSMVGDKVTVVSGDDNLRVFTLRPQRADVETCAHVQLAAATDNATHVVECFRLIRKRKTARGMTCVAATGADIIAGANDGTLNTWTVCE